MLNHLFASLFAFIALFSYTTASRPSPRMSTFYPSSLDLVSSSDPNLYTKMIDLTPMLGEDVIAFNKANPGKEISLLGKVSKGGGRGGASEGGEGEPRARDAHILTTRSVAMNRRIPSMNCLASLRPPPLPSFALPYTSLLCFSPALRPSS